MSRSLSRWQALSLGLVVLLGVGLGLLGLFAVGSRGWFGKDVLHVRVGFKEIRGVEVGTRVRIQGMEAGEVEGIAAPEQADGLVVLRLRLKGQYRHLVRATSTVQIVGDGMLGGKVLEVRPPPSGSVDGGPAGEDFLLHSEPTTELADLMGDVRATLKGIENGQGTIPKLLHDPEAYRGLVKLLNTTTEVAEHSKEAASTIQRDAEAMKRLPLVGGYVEDPVRILVRPKCEKNRKTFAEEELFEPGRADLTSEGKARLDRELAWVSGLLPHKGAEVVVVAYADPKRGSPRSAGEVTRQQSETVVEYLREHKVHKVGWWSSRTLTPLGMGTQEPPERESSALPPARVELLVFVPRG